MTLLNERDYRTALMNAHAKATGRSIVTQQEYDDLFVTNPRPHEAYELRFPWGSQVLFVWEEGG